MRSTIIAAAAFAASAVAIPYAQPDVVTAYDTDVVYVTNVVTVTEGAAAAAATTVAAAAEEEPKEYGGNHGWHWPHKGKTSTHKKKTRTRTRTHAPAPQPTQTSEASPPPAESTTAWEEPATYAPAPPASTTEPASTPKPEAPAESAPSYGGGYQGMALEHHNVHRANHSDTAPLEWDANLAATAQKIGESCVYAHDTDVDADMYPDGYGQNIAAGVEGGNVSAVISDLFYNGEFDLYGLNTFGKNPDMSNFEGWGHLTQIVWKGTKKVGCATVHCPNGLGNTGSTTPPYFTVCNYSPPGNYANEYDVNVCIPKGEPTADSFYSA